jgi:ParB-like chromosome segregation protein Spo0J
VSALAVTPEPPSDPAVVQLPIDQLRVGPPLRERGIDHAHVAALAEVAASWPPIVVHRTDRLVIDGQHRVAAAKQLGLHELAATWFDGSPEDAFVEFVRRNVNHGLPLTLADRRRAARQIVDIRPDLSDRGIAAVCGLSPRTVARLREDARARAPRANGTRYSSGRVGRDGRVRPIDPVATRARIAEELDRRPDASLRAIAGVVGASPETVRSVRNEMRAAAAPAPHAVAPEPAPTANVLDVLARARKGPVGVDCRDDRAFTDRDGGQEFVEWFDGTAVELGDLWRYVDAVPLSRVYVIADEARRRAEFWAQFAMAVEGRVRLRA